MEYKLFEEKAGVTFNDHAILKQAFTHRSYINENRESGLSHNERLEFLGDAVLELIITDYLYKNFPDKTEGELTSFRSALVNANTLSDVASKLSMNDFLLLSKGEAKDTGRARQYILANTFEAVVGAMYLDGGYDVAKDFLERNVAPLIGDIVRDGSWVDAKSKFQEKAQEVEGITPEYKTLKEIGPDHDKKFEVGVYLGKELVEKGIGKSKQEAEQEAAKKALEKSKWSK